LANAVRRAHLGPEMRTLAALVVQSQLNPTPEIQKLYESVMAGRSDRLAECLVGLIQDPEFPAWVRGLAMMAAAPAAGLPGFAGVRGAILEAHESSEPTLYRHAVLALRQVEGDDAVSSLLGGLQRQDEKYHELLRGILFERLKGLSPPDLVARFARHHADGERRFVELGGGRLPELLDAAPSPGELYLFDSLAYHLREVKSLGEMLGRPELSEHEKWFLCQVLQHWPDGSFVPAARRLLRDKSARVRVEAAGLLAACGEADEAFPVLAAAALATSDQALAGKVWPYQVGGITTQAGGITWTTRPWTPSLWVTTLRVAQPGPLDHRALLLLGHCKTEASLDILMKALGRRLRGVSANALASLCQLASEPALAREINAQFEKRLLPLYQEPLDWESVNLGLLAGLLGRKDERVLAFLRQTARKPPVENEVPLDGINALWALAQAGEPKARDAFHQVAEKWINDRIEAGTRSVWLAAHLIETRRDLGRAETLLAEAEVALKGQPEVVLPPLGLVLTRVELEVARNRPKQARELLGQLLGRPVLADRLRLEAVGKWLDAGATGAMPLADRWRSGSVDREYGWTDQRFTVR
jgi:hypothetical protein